MTAASATMAPPAPHRRGRSGLMRLAWGLLLTASLAGCATSISRQQQDQAAPSQDGAADTLLAGRLSMVIAPEPSSSSTEHTPPAQSLSASFELRGSPTQGSLDLISPLGSVLARASWSPAQALLVTGKGERRFQDLPGLTREMLGESMPVDALFDWLRGRPSPAFPSTAPNGDTAAPPDPSGFTQLGWRVDLSRFAQSIIMAERNRAPRVTLRVRLDTP